MTDQTESQRLKAAWAAAWDAERAASYAAWAVREADAAWEAAADAAWVAAVAARAAEGEK